MTPLPSTAALRTFETAARLLNFTAAARALNLSQGAVSQQMRELESRLGVALFERGGRGLSLTEAGRDYLPFAREALAHLRDGSEAVRRRANAARLTVSVSPNFAAKWLVPRLGAYLAAYPEVDLRISASLRHVDFAGDGIDMAVRHGTGAWPGLDVVRLCAETTFPVISPLLLASRPPPVRPEDLLCHPLIHDRGRDGWAAWLDAIGVQASDADRLPGPVFDQTSLAIDAAVAGQGVALARSALVALDLAAGRLVRPLPDAVPAAFAYWIVCPKAAAGSPQVKRFRRWLLDQAAADQAGLAGAGATAGAPAG